MVQRRASLLPPPVLCAASECICFPLPADAVRIRCCYACLPPLDDPHWKGVASCESEIRVEPASSAQTAAARASSAQRT